MINVAAPNCVNLLVVVPILKGQAFQFPRLADEVDGSIEKDTAKIGPWKCQIERAVDIINRGPKVDGKPCVLHKAAKPSSPANGFSSALRPDAKDPRGDLCEFPRTSS